MDDSRPNSNARHGIDGPSLVERAAEELDRRTQDTRSQSNDRRQPQAQAATTRFARGREPLTGAAKGPSSPTVPVDQERLKAYGGLTSDQMQSRLSEEMRLIKQGLIRRMYTGTEGHSNVVQITSAWPGEGKSFLAVNLALSLATEIDLHVLLVDLDIHRSTVNDAFGIKPEKGLLDVVQDRMIDLSEVIIRTDIPRFSVIGTGRTRQLSTELLASQRMHEVTAELSERYHDRVILFDTPPLLGTSEPAVLAQLAGQVVFVVEADRTTRRAIDQAMEQLPADARTSIVLNKSRGLIGGSSLPYYGYYKN